MDELIRLFAADGGEFVSQLRAKTGIGENRGKRSCKPPSDFRRILKRFPSMLENKVAAFGVKYEIGGELKNNRGTGAYLGCRLIKMPPSFTIATRIRRLSFEENHIKKI